jgi:ABC-type sulfate transport system substrate-binding protein
VAVMVDANVTAAERPAAQAFLRYLSSDAGQRLLERSYLRPIDCRSDQLPALAQPFTVEDLGGWTQAYTQLIEGLWQSEIEPSLQLETAPMQGEPGE